MDDCRKAFEEWASNEGYNVKLHALGDYAVQSTAFAWHSWQGCCTSRPSGELVTREAIEIIRLLVGKYLQNQGTAHEFVSCVTPDRGSETHLLWKRLSEICRSQLPAPVAEVLSTRTVEQYREMMLTWISNETGEGYSEEQLEDVNLYAFHLAELDKRSGRKLPSPVADVPSVDQMIQCFQTAGNLWGEGIDTTDEDYGIDPQADMLKFQMKELRSFLAHTSTSPVAEVPSIQGPRFVRGAIADLKDALTVDDKRHFERCIRSALARLDNEDVKARLTHTRPDMGAVVEPSSIDLIVGDPNGMYDLQRDFLAAKAADHPQLFPYMVLMENGNGEPRALGVEGRFKKWCFRPVNGKWVTYHQFDDEQFDEALEALDAINGYRSPGGR